MPATAPDPRPVLPAPAEEADEVEALDPEPKPLHRSLPALRTEGSDERAREGAALRAFFGAVELANTDCPPLWVTPAVAPLSRAEKDDEVTWELPAPLPERDGPRWPRAPAF